MNKPGTGMDQAQAQSEDSPWGGMGNAMGNKKRPERAVFV
jgi:hypothetical protein